MARTKTASAGASKKGSRRDSPRFKAKPTSTPAVIRWSAVEDYPAKRWWWFLGFGLVGAWLFTIAMLLQSWSHVLLIGVVVPSLIVLYAQKPRTMTYELNLDDETLTINGRDRAHLNTFRSFTIEEPVNPKRRQSIVLVPDQTWAWPVEVFVPDDARLATNVFDAISSFTPFSAADNRDLELKFIDHCATLFRFR